MAAAANTLVIACGALAKEIVALRQANGWSHMDVSCLPAELHNRPEKIPAAVREKIQRFKGSYDHLFVAYADCGTGGTDGAHSAAGSATIGVRGSSENNGSDAFTVAATTSSTSAL
jgi:hypothetical protein